MTKKLTIELPPKQHQALKVAAAMRQTTMQALVVAALQKHLPAKPERRGVSVMNAISSAR